MLVHLVVVDLLVDLVLVIASRPVAGSFKAPGIRLAKAFPCRKPEPSRPELNAYDAIHHWARKMICWA